MGKGDRKGGAGSAKAAESLLSQAGTGAKFGGFVGSTPASTGAFSFGSNYVSQVVSGSDVGPSPGSAATRSAIIPADLDGELSQQLQRLSKRDSTTRLKALQALRALVAEKSVADVLHALPSWAYLFERLVMDANRGVRSEACQTMGAVAAVVGREVAPFLKTLLPPWYMAQFDGHADVAAAAQAAMLSAFPGSKQHEAVLFCRAEVMRLLQDNLGSSPQSLGDARKESAEELQERHERVLGTTCAAAAALVGVATSTGDTPLRPTQTAAVQEVRDGLGGMLQAPGLARSILQSKASLVRRSGYTLIASVARVAPDLLSEDTLSPAVLGAVGERDPSNHPAMWDMVLSFVKTHPASWGHVNISKAFLPRLWALLRQGCYGSASSSYPALLPLLAMLPADRVTPALMGTLLTSVWQGLKGLPEGQGRDAAAACFQECLLYALQRTEQLAGGGAAAPFCEELLAAALPATLLPAAVSPCAEAGTAGEILCSVAAKLAGLSREQTASRWKLAAVLRVVGSQLEASVQAALAPDQGPPPVSLALISELVPKLVAAASGAPQQGGISTAVGQPLMAVLAPAVHSDEAPAEASSLLAVLMQCFPAEAGVDPGAASSSSSSGPALAPAPAAGAAAVTADLAAVRLQHSASFTLTSVLYRLGNADQDDATLAASCDLLVSCLPHAAQPAVQLVQALRRVMAAHGAGGAVVLLKRLIAAPAPPPLASFRSPELDALCVEVCRDAEQLVADGAAVRLVALLLLAGGGPHSLLSETGQEAALRQLAVRAGPGQEPEVQVAALSIVQAAVAAPPALTTGQGVARQLVGLLAASFSLLLAETMGAAQAGVQPGSGSEDDTDSAVDMRLDHSQVYTLAASLWSDPQPVAALMQLADSDVQHSFVAAVADSVHAAVGEGAGDSDQGAATSAAVSCVQAAWRACDSSPLQQDLLSALASRVPAPQFLLQLGQAVGFRELLAALQSQAAPTAVTLLQAAPSATAGVHSLTQHLVSDEGSALLQQTLAVALDRSSAGPSSASAFATLLASAFAAGGSAAATAAAFFSAHIVDSRDTGLLNAVLSATTLLLRQDAALLRQSRLSELALRLCHQASKEDGSAVLDAAVACFPSHAVAPPAVGQAAASSSQQPQFAKGDLAWYQNKLDGVWEEAAVVAVDVSLQPPSYTVQVQGRQRETEGSRLRPRAAGERVPPPPAPTSEHAMADHGLECSAEERQALLELSRHSALSPNPEPAVHAGLLRCSAAYCWRLFSESDWVAVLDQMQASLAVSVQVLARAADGVAAALMDAAASVAGSPLGSPALALHFFQRLMHKGLLQSSGKVSAQAAQVGTALERVLSQLQLHQHTCLLPCLQSFLQAAAVAPHSRTLPALKWQQAQASVCSAALACFASMGCLVGLAEGCGQRTTVLALQQPDCQQVWDCLGGVVLHSLHTADETFLRSAVEAADVAGQLSGCDCVDALLALALSAAGPPALQSAAYQALLLHPALTAALTGAAAASEDPDVVDAAAGARGEVDATELLEQAGVRTELAAAVASPAHPRFLTAWALLTAHVIALPQGSGGRRLLVQYLKEAHTLVPQALGALLPLLPLQAYGPGGGRADGTPPQGRRASLTGGSKVGVGGQSPAADVSASGFTQRLLLAGLPEGDCSLADFASQLFAGMLHALPVSARLWFSELRDKGAAAALERFTAAVVSPGLLAAEYAAVQELAAQVGRFDKFSVRSIPGSREVVAALEVEEGHLLELVVKLPAALPLRPPEATCRRSVGVQEARLRKWLLSITAFLRAQNGAVAGAIRLWKRNVDNEFEGQEDCLICFSIIQPSTGQLPRLACRTCRKRFHGTCLYKWFSSSGKSNCPHCQSPW